MNAFVDLLILAAHPAELLGLHLALGASLRGRVGALNIVAADVGVGLTLAGAGAMRRLIEERPQSAIVVGSYGRYPDKLALQPGRLLVPTRLVAIDGHVLDHTAAFPEPMPVVLAPDEALSRGLAAKDGGSLERASVATTFAITTDDGLARELSERSGCIAENLEALAIGLACQSFGVPFSAVLGCTNIVGAQGRSQWAEHHPLVATATANHVLDWLQRGAPGIQRSIPSLSGRGLG